MIRHSVLVPVSVAVAFEVSFAVTAVAATAVAAAEVAITVRAGRLRLFQRWPWMQWGQHGWWPP